MSKNCSEIVTDLGGKPVTTWAFLSKRSGNFPSPCEFTVALYAYDMLFKVQS